MRFGGGGPTGWETVDADPDYLSTHGLRLPNGQTYIAAGRVGGADLFSLQDGAWVKAHSLNFDSRAGRVALADLDLDGDVDVVIGAEQLYGGVNSMGLIIARNDAGLFGYDVIQADFHTTSSSGDLYATQFGDLKICKLDGNDYPDILASAFGSAYVLWEMLSADGVHYTGQKSSQMRFESLETADLNGDTHLDLVGPVGHGIQHATGTPTGIPLSFLSIFEFPGDYDFAHDVKMLDWDQDGNADVVTAGDTQEVVALLNSQPNPGSSFYPLSAFKTDSVIRFIEGEAKPEYRWLAVATDTGLILEYRRPFVDVLSTNIFSLYIEKIFAQGITAGCGDGNYCPDLPVTRAQMAVFLEKGLRTPHFVPAAQSGVFLDVPIGHWAGAWIEQLALDGVTAGCGDGKYCPDAPVTRAQMAVFLLKAKYGSTYVPPAQTGRFDDVPIGHWAGAWIEQLAAEGITAGCGPTSYCPDAPVTRGQMAVFLTKTFGF